MKSVNDVKMTKAQKQLACGIIYQLDELSCGFHWVYSPKDEHSCWLEGINNHERLVLASYTYPTHGFDVIVPKDFDLDTLTFYQNLDDEEWTATLGFESFADLKKALDEIYECEDAETAAGLWCYW